MISRWWWPLLLLCWLPAGAWAQQTYVWTDSNVNPVQYGDDAVATARAAAEINGVHSCSSYQCLGAVSSVTCNPSGAPASSGAGSTCAVVYDEVCQAGRNCAGLSTTFDWSTSLGSTLATNAPKAASCAGRAGQETNIQTTGSTGVQQTGVDADGCQWTYSGDVTVCADLGSGTECSQGVTYTGTTATGTATATSGNNCVSGGGVTACVQSTGPNAGQCGTFNGDQVCPSAMPDNSCVFYSSGGSACTVSGTTVASGAPTAAGGGAAGVTGTVTPATPSSGGDANCAATKCTTDTNYYSSSTVAGSPTGVTGQSGGQNASSGSGSGAGDGKGNKGTECGNGTTSDGAGGCASDSLSGGVDCSSPPVCSGDPIQCDIDAQAFRERCPGAPSSGDIAGALGQYGSVENPGAPHSVDVTGSITTSHFGDTGTSCPAPLVLNIMGQSVTLDPWTKFCSWMQLIQPLVLLFATLAAGRVLMGAV